MKSEMNNLSDSNKLLKAVLKGAACSIATFALGFNDMSKTEAGGWNLLHPSPAFAVSGGGKDYATKDLRESDFTGAILDNKDFTQCSKKLNPIVCCLKLISIRFMLLSRILHECRCTRN